MVAFGWTLAVLAAAGVVVRANVDPIVIKGSKFFYKTNGTQFFIRGVAYQQDAGTEGSTGANAPDPLTDAAGCKRDIPYLQQLRTNAVRVYSIDPTGDHDDCMNALADAGIYVIADLSSSNQSIDSNDPSWNVDLYNRYSSVIDTMAKYNNMIGFFAGNEVIFSANVSNSAPFVKAAVRDMKAYIKQKNYRPMGVGYAADDDQYIRAPMENFLNCGEVSDGIDFFGYNVYSWCGAKATFESSNYEARTKEFANYSVPVFFAEYGCITSPPRTFSESLALFGDEMSDVWSGGFVFEYFEAPNKYGLVTLSGGSISTLSDFKALSTQMAKIDPSSTNSAKYTPTNTELRDCPETTSLSGSSGWLAATALPPTPNQELCLCMVKNLTCNVKANIQSTVIGQLFNYSCPEAGACDGIEHDGENGIYGAYSMCAPQYQLAWSFNNYYFQHPGSNDACDFSGNATKQDPQVSSGCAALLSQAGAAGTGHVTSVPTGHPGSGSGGSSGSGSSSSSAAVAVSIPAFDVRFLSFGAYLTLAAVAGAGMILL